MKKRILAVLLCICLCLGLLPTAALAADAQLWWAAPTPNSGWTEWFDALPVPQGGSVSVELFTASNAGNRITLSSDSSVFNINAPISGDASVFTVAPAAGANGPLCVVTATGEVDATAQLTITVGDTTYALPVTIAEATGGGNGGEEPGSGDDGPSGITLNGDSFDLQLMAMVTNELWNEEDNKWESVQELRCQSMRDGVLDINSSSSFQRYIVLCNRTQDRIADLAENQLFWDAYTVQVTLEEADPADAAVSLQGGDANGKVTFSFAGGNSMSEVPEAMVALEGTGGYRANVRFAAVPKQDGGESIGFGEPVEVSIATFLTGTDGVYTTDQVPLDKVVYYALDLDKEIVAQVSAQLTGLPDGWRGNVNVKDAHTLWGQDENGTPWAEAYAFSGQQLMLGVSSWSNAPAEPGSETFTLTVTVEEEVPHLFYKSLWWNGNAVQFDDFGQEEFCIPVRNEWDLQFFYGTSHEAAMVDPENVTVTVAVADGDTPVAKFEAGAVEWMDNDVHFRVTGLAVGDATAHVSAAIDDVTVERDFDVTVTLPDLAFYTTAQRAADTMVWDAERNGPNVTYGEGEGEYTVVYYLKDGGFTSDEAADVTFTPTRWDNSEMEWVEAEDLELGKEVVDLGEDGLGLKVTLADPGEEDYWICVAVNGTERRGMGVYPFRENGGGLTAGLGLMYCWYDESIQGVKYNSSFLQSCWLEPGMSNMVRFVSWDGTGDPPNWDDDPPASYVIPASVTVEESSIAAIEETENDCYLITAKKVTGETKLIVTLGEGDAAQVCEIPLTVRLPDLGFFSAPSRSGETYVNQVSYEEDLALYLIQAGGFTQEDMDASWTFTWASDEDTPPLLDVSPQWVETTDGNGKALKFTVPELIWDNGWLQVRKDGMEQRGIWVEKPFFGSQGVEIDVNGTTYCVAFGMEDGLGFQLSMSGCFGISSNDVGSVDERLEFHEPPTVYAGTIAESGECKKAPDGLFTLQVTKMTIEPVDGDQTNFSWAKDSLVLETTDITNGVTGPQLWANPSIDSSVYVYADVNVTVGGETSAVQVKMAAFVDTVSGTIDLIRPEDDTVAALNADLAALAGEIPEEGGVNYNVILNPYATYTGTITLPDSGVFDWADNINLNIIGSTDFDEDNNFYNVTVTGGLDLNGNHILNVYDINFVAPEDAGDAKGIYNGDCMMAHRCSFTGYTVAVDSADKGMINCRSCTFTDNAVATSIDVGSIGFGTRNFWELNNFMGNGTAVQMKSFNQSVAPYCFHIYDSNFVDNDCDFDLVPANTVVYMYRNYFGAGAGARAADSYTAREPRVRLGTDSHVCAEPRWTNFVQLRPNDQGDLQISDNALTVNWENSVSILNEEAADGRLNIDASAFEVDRSKIIDMLNSTGSSVIGTWTFAGSQARAASLFSAGLLALADQSAGDFDPVLNVEETSEGYAVTVQDSAVLARYAPTLTVAGGADWENAAVTGPDGKAVACTWNAEDHTVTFPTAAGGTYEVQAAEKASPVEPDTPTVPATPTAPAPETVTVPASGDSGSTNVTASLSGSSVAVGEVKSSDLEEIVNAATEPVNVVIDLSSLGQTVDNATLTNSTLKTISDAANADGSGITGLEIRLTTAAVTLDAAALQAVLEQAGSGTVTVAVTSVGLADLNAKQRAAVEELEDPAVVDAYFLAGSKRIETLGEGKLGLTVPYVLTKGAAVVDYVDNEGKLERLTCSYDPAAKTVSFETSHNSYYALSTDDDPCVSFADIDREAWYHEAVDYAIENGFMAGDGAGRFAPLESLSRAMLCQILYNKAGKPAVTARDRFTDVPAGQWYTDAVLWAQEKGYIEGYDGKFCPDQDVTREQLAVILWRYDGKKTSTASLDAFPDADKISGYALDALRWAYEGKVISGKGGGLLDPQGSATRAEVAQMLMNYLKK